LHVKLFAGNLTSQSLQSLGGVGGVRGRLFLVLYSLVCARSVVFSNGQL
jgi:hypothetical protein